MMRLPNMVPSYLHGALTRRLSSSSLRQEEKSSKIDDDASDTESTEETSVLESPRSFIASTTSSILGSWQDDEGDDEALEPPATTDALQPNQLAPRKIGAPYAGKTQTSFAGKNHDISTAFKHSKEPHSCATTTPNDSSQLKVVWPPMNSSSTESRKSAPAQTKPVSKSDFTSAISDVGNASMLSAGFSLSDLVTEADDKSLDLFLDILADASSADGSLNHVETSRLKKAYDELSQDFMSLGEGDSVFDAKSVKSAFGGFLSARAESSTGLQAQLARIAAASGLDTQHEAKLPARQELEDILRQALSVWVDRQTENAKRGKKERSKGSNSPSGGRRRSTVVKRPHPEGNSWSASCNRGVEHAGFRGLEPPVWGKYASAKKHGNDRTPMLRGLHQSMSSTPQMEQPLSKKKVHHHHCHAPTKPNRRKSLNGLDAFAAVQEQAGKQGVYAPTRPSRRLSNDFQGTEQPLSPRKNASEHAPSRPLRRLSNDTGGPRGNESCNSAPVRPLRRLSCDATETHNGLAQVRSWCAEMGNGKRKTQAGQGSPENPSPSACIEDRTYLPQVQASNENDQLMNQTAWSLSVQSEHSTFATPSCSNRAGKQDTSSSHFWTSPPQTKSRSVSLSHRTPQLSTQLRTNGLLGNYEENETGAGETDDWPWYSETKEAKRKSETGRDAASPAGRISLETEMSSAQALSFSGLDQKGCSFHETVHSAQSEHSIFATPSRSDRKGRGFGLSRPILGNPPNTMTQTDRGPQLPTRLGDEIVLGQVDKDPAHAQTSIKEMLKAKQNSQSEHGSTSSPRRASFYTTSNLAQDPSCSGLVTPTPQRDFNQSNAFHSQSEHSTVATPSSSSRKGMGYMLSLPFMSPPQNTRAQSEDLSYWTPQLSSKLSTSSLMVSNDGGATDDLKEGHPKGLKMNDGEVSGARPSFARNLLRSSSSCGMEGLYTKDLILSRDGNKDGDMKYGHLKGPKESEGEVSATRSEFCKNLLRRSSSRGYTRLDPGPSTLLHPVSSKEGEQETENPLSEGCEQVKDNPSVLDSMNVMSFSDHNGWQSPAVPSKSTLSGSSFDDDAFFRPQFKDENKFEGPHRRAASAGKADILEPEESNHTEGTSGSLSKKIGKPGRSRGPGQKAQAEETFSWSRASGRGYHSRKFEQSTTGTVTPTLTKRRHSSIGGFPLGPERPNTIATIGRRASLGSSAVGDAIVAAVQPTNRTHQRRRSSTGASSVGRAQRRFARRSSKCS